MGYPAEVLKIFFERHLMKSSLAIVFAIATYTYYPIFFEDIKNISEYLYILFLLFAYFIIVNSVHGFYKYIVNEIKAKKYRKIKSEEAYGKTMEDFWCFTDGLSLETKSILKEFILTNNMKPYLCPSNRIVVLGISERLLNISNFIMTSATHTDDYMLDSALAAANLFSEEGKSNQWRIEVSQIKLEEQFYKLLKHSYEKYGRISHFD